MAIEIIRCEQNTPEWLTARLGIPTASEFATVMAKGRSKGERSKTRDAYMRRLADEVIYGEIEENGYTNPNMERGKVMQAEAESIYALTHDVELDRVGCIRHVDDYTLLPTYGCSPDALIGDKGQLEIKTTYPQLLVGMHLAGVFPSEHLPQCQGGLWVSEREWIDLMVYWPRRKPFIKRAYRDEKYIMLIEVEVRRFLDELNDMVERMRRLAA